MSTTPRTPRRARTLLAGIAIAAATLGGASTVEAQTDYPPTEEQPSTPAQPSAPAQPPASDSSPTLVASAAPSAALPATGTSTTSTIVMFAGLTLLAGFAVSIWAGMSKRRHGADDLLGTSAD